MTTPAWFVTGTDTGVGKSRVAAALLRALAARYPRVVGMKPVAAGLPRLDDGSVGVNDDVLALRAAGTLAVDAALDNPYALAAAVSPHIAALREHVVIDVAHLARCCATLRSQADAVVVEGAGGLLVPLGEAVDGGDLAVALDLPMILVVGLRLGCLNHARLTVDALIARGLRLAGWVANTLDASMPERAANLAYLRTQIHQRTGAPLLADLPWQPEVDLADVAACLDLDALQA